MEKIIIAAMAENRVIGKDGDLPWHIPEDMEHFKETTTGFPVIMGRKTFESLPENFRPLPNRTNIVLTRSSVDNESVIEANSLEEAWDAAERTGENKAFVIGGASVYEQSMEHTDKMILTEVHRNYDGDTYFPEWDESNWEEESREEHENFDFVTYIRVTHF